MADPRSGRTIALCSAPGTLGGIDSLLERAGVRLIRIPTLQPRPVPPAPWLARVARVPNVDTVVVTSRTGVAAGVTPWLRSTPGPGSIEFWSVGPGTARALRDAGILRVRTPASVGATALARELPREPPRTILYFRSDRAGPDLARSLRRKGHRVADLVVYRVERNSRGTPQNRRDLARADLWVATSPSSLTALRHLLGPRTFSQLRRTTPLVVLGGRSRQVAADQGYRTVSIAPTTTTQRFTRHLLRELRDVGP
jgi:uroporphyrinogen-III synthase